MMPSLAVATCKAVAAQSPAQIAEIASLRALVAAKQDRIDELERIVGLTPDTPIAITMTPTARRIVGVLLKAKGWTSVAALEQLLWGALPDCDWPRDPRVNVKVHVHHARRALKPYGVTIDTIFAAGAGGGYFMAADMKARFAAVNARLAQGEAA